MANLIFNAYPAGEEEDASDDEWDLGFSTDKKPTCTKDLDPAGPDVKDDVLELKRAINEGDVKTMERLLDNGMDVEIRLGFGWNPLMCAVSVANHDLAKALLDRGASANFSKDGWTVLMAGCMASAGEDQIARCVELLLSRNADPNMTDRSNITCLMLAAREGHSKVINLLACHGAELDAQELNGYTALSLAVQHCRKDAVLKLLQLGADTSIKTKAGSSPADLARTHGFTQISRILVSHKQANMAAATPSPSMEEMLSKFFSADAEPPPGSQISSRLEGLDLLLHGLDLPHLADTLREQDITWSDLLSMEEEDLAKLGVTDSADQEKIRHAMQQMHQDPMELDLLGATDGGSEELQSFLLAVRQQCCNLTEVVQDVIKHFPRNPSQLVFSLDSKKESQVTCSQLVIQVKDLQRELICLRNLIAQMDNPADCCHVPPRRSRGNRKMESLAVMALGAAAAAATVFLVYQAAGGRAELQL